MRIAITTVVLTLSLVLGGSPILAQGQPAVDGKIATSEYPNTYKHEASGMQLAWRITGDTMQLAIHVFTTEGGKAVALDLYQSVVLGRPVLDEDEGGKNSILQAAVVRDGKNWTVEFTRKLRTGEKTDMETTPGRKFSLLLALGATDNWKQPHKNTQRWEIGGFAF